MSNWLEENDPRAARAQPHAATLEAGAEVALRRADRLLSGLLLLALGLPLWLLHARWHRQAAQGRHGERFERLSLDLPQRGLWRGLRGLGARHWPVLINIWRGQMSFVGPRARQLGEDPPQAAVQALRPGLINPWFVRRRTAVDFGSEAESELDYLGRRGLRHDLGLLLRGLLLAALPTSPQQPPPARIGLVDVQFDNLSMAQALERIESMLEGREARQVCFVNPACVNIAAHDRGYRRLLARADLVLPDGIGIKIGTSLLGQPLRQNVNGTDLFPRLAQRLQTRGCRVFLLGGQPGVPERVAARMAELWPGLQIMGLRDGFFSVAEEGDVVRQIRASGAELLLVARGVPAQELFVNRYLPLLGVKVAMGVGGLFDFICGRISRAPQWMRESGLEWVWRLMQEPGRMWRRYLIGNFSFLGRVLLQRLGLRKARTDPLPAQEAAQPSAAPARALLFVHERAGGDLPVDADQPAGLLPLACASAIETLMARLAEAGVQELALACCERPEALRAVLGDGARWGLRLRWLLVKEPQYPYGVLREVLRHGGERLLLGHADVCPDAAMLRGLLEGEALLLEDGPEGEELRWSGWASLGGATEIAGLEDLDHRALGARLLHGGLAARVLPRGRLDRLGDARSLLKAQRAACQRLPAEVPASWISHPWGAASPMARIDKGARLQGPVLIGAGCIVERGAQLGPNVVLAQDAVVGAGSRLRDSVVLSGTYVGRDLDIESAVVGGNRIRLVGQGLEICMPEDDAVLLRLDQPAPGRLAPLLGRLAAGLLLLALGWVLLARQGLVRLGLLPPAWRRRLVVVGREALGQGLRVAPLRCVVSGATPALRRWAWLAGLLDVLAGQRRWFGARPRTVGQWYALRPEWQQTLARLPVGLLHAPAWCDQAPLQDEANAIADVYAALQTPWQRLRALLAHAVAGRQADAGVLAQR